MMRSAARMAWMATALVVAALASPAAQASQEAGDAEQTFRGVVGIRGGGQLPSGYEPQLEGGQETGLVLRRGVVGLRGGGQLPSGYLIAGISAGPALGRPAAPADGFDWADAGVGAGIAVGAILLAGLATCAVRRQKLAHS
jgi:hypothetical protein